MNLRDVGYYAKEVLDNRKTTQEYFKEVKEIRTSIISYNLKRWGDNRCDSLLRFKTVIDIISGHDIIALQELYGNSISMFSKVLLTHGHITTRRMSDGELLTIFYRHDKYDVIASYEPTSFLDNFKFKRNVLIIFFREKATLMQFMVVNVHISPGSKSKTVMQLNMLEKLYDQIISMWNAKVGSVVYDLPFPVEEFKVFLSYVKVSQLKYSVLVGDFNMDQPFVHSDKRDLNFYDKGYRIWFDGIRTNTGQVARTYSNIISRPNLNLLCEVENSWYSRAIMAKISDHYPISCRIVEMVKPSSPKRFLPRNTIAAPFILKEIINSFCKSNFGEVTENKK